MFDTNIIHITKTCKTKDGQSGYFGEFEIKKKIQKSGSTCRSGPEGQWPALCKIWKVDRKLEVWANQVNWIVAYCSKIMHIIGIVYTTR